MRAQLDCPLSARSGHRATSLDHLVGASAGLNHSAVMAGMMQLAALFGGAFQSRL
jgi:hypothetical protein